MYLYLEIGTAIALEYDEAANDIVVDFHTYGKGYEALMTLMVVFVIRLLLPLLNMRILVMVLCVRLFIR